jgi:lipopolysaccharide export system protein LptA
MADGFSRSLRRVLAAAAATALCMALPSIAENTAPGKKDGLLAGDGLLESFSLSADRGPVRVEAATLEFEYRTGELTYRGGVTVSQADITLSSDTLLIVLDTENIGRPKEIVAEGNVRIVNGERVATGGRAVFDQTAQTITLSRNAVLRDGPNEVAGEKVIVFLEEQRSVVEGGGERVRAVLFPSGEATAPDAAAVSKAPADAD